MKGLSVTREVVEQAVRESTTYKEVAERLGRYPGHYFINQLKTWIDEFGINQSHLACKVSEDRWLYDNVYYAVKNCMSYTDALIMLGVKHRSGNFNTLKKKIAEYGLLVDHFDATAATASTKRANGSETKVPLNEVLAGNHPTFKTGQLKKRLIAEGVKEHKCDCCGIDSWNGNSITLDLDHINGISDDHRLDNLRLLCPNCHSQTPTYKGRNKCRVS